MSVKRILISQQQPLNMAPYAALTEKYGVEIEFNQFFKLEPLTSREFRTQRVNLPDYTAIVFFSRHAIDAYFQLCEELRVKVPETMKYFCSTEAVAMYLQKHIVFRKRKIFFGNGTPSSVVDLIGSKHKDENFLIATADTASNDSISSNFSAHNLKHTIATFVKGVPRDMSGVDINSYDIIVFYNPHDVESLQSNFPEFKQGDIKFISFGRNVVKSMEEAGLSIEIKAPTPEVKSVASAIELYLEKNK
ncbi:MAG: uroporphyrinogen-III synthase [Bacteroidales bacterium]|nr:uroporphyrinogen-III synthase [Bacteroidales bacterium]